MQFKHLILLCCSICILAMAVNPLSAADTSEEQARDNRKYESNRPDGRYVSTLGFAHNAMKTLPQLAFDPAMEPADFPKWQSAIRAKTLELMAFPENVPVQPDPKRLWSEPRAGYTLEKWEIYPEPAAVVPILMLIPDGVTSKKPAPAVMCIPGSSGTKEYLAGEPECHPDLKPSAHADKNHMALEFARAGMVAIATDHPGSGEALERLGDKLLGGATRDKLCRDLFYLGRSFSGISTFHKAKILDWMKTHPCIDSSRLAVAGHSLGTEAVLMLAVIDPDVAAVVLNDFIHGKRTQDIALGKTMNDKHIFFTGGMWHTVPGMWQWFDLPDLAAAIAPRALLGTEGGTVLALNNVKQAYTLANAPKAFQFSHFPEFNAPEKRPFDHEPMPEGLLINDYFKRAHTNPDQHYFKGHLAVPWLCAQFGISEK